MSMHQHASYCFVIIRCTTCFLSLFSLKTTRLAMGSLGPPRRLHLDLGRPPAVQRGSSRSSPRPWQAREQRAQWGLIGPPCGSRSHMGCKDSRWVLLEKGACCAKTCEDHAWVFLGIRPKPKVYKQSLSSNKVHSRKLIFALSSKLWQWCATIFGIIVLYMETCLEGSDEEEDRTSIHEHTVNVERQMSWSTDLEKQMVGDEPFVEQCCTMSLQLILAYMEAIGVTDRDQLYQLYIGSGRN